MTERWAAIPGWEGLYEVSDFGQVRCLKRHRVCARVLTPSAAGLGYRKVQLVHHERREHRYVHELVLTTFVGPRPEKQECAHGNGQRDDNRLVNLRWDTRSGNHADKNAHGTACVGERHGRRKLSLAQVVQIRAAQEPPKVLAQRFGVGLAQISRIRSGGNWR